MIEGAIIEGPEFAVLRAIRKSTRRHRQVHDQPALTRVGGVMNGSHNCAAQ
jgi:hypothetical protein